MPEDRVELRLKVFARATSGDRLVHGLVLVARFRAPTIGEISRADWNLASLVETAVEEVSSPEAAADGYWRADSVLHVVSRRPWVPSAWAGGTVVFRNDPHVRSEPFELAPLWESLGVGSVLNARPGDAMEKLVV